MKKRYWPDWSRALSISLRIFTRMSRRIGQLNLHPQQISHAVADQAANRIGLA